MKDPEKSVQHNRSQSIKNSMLQMESMLASSTMSPRTNILCPTAVPQYYCQSWTRGRVDWVRTELVAICPLCNGSWAPQCLWTLLLWVSVDHQKPFRLASGSKKVKTHQRADLVLSGCILEICHKYLYWTSRIFMACLTRKSIISWRNLFIFCRMFYPVLSRENVV